MSRVEQIVTVLDGLTEATTAQVADALREFDPGDVAAAAAARALAGGESGGSQPGTARRLTVDVDAADLAEGPITLYTPEAGEVVGPVYLYGVEFTNSSTAIVIGRVEQVAGDQNFPPLAAWDSDLSRDGAGMAAAGVSDVQRGEIPLTIGPVTAGFSNDGSVAGTPAPAWQAGHVYAGLGADSIVAAGHVWYAEPGGTSGGTKPDFAGNIGGTVADGAGALVWNDSAEATGGSATVSFDVCVPVAL